MSGRRRSPAVPPSVAVLVPFVDAGLFGPTEIHLAATVARLAPEVAPEVILGLAVAARGPRLGHVCIDLHDVHRLIVDDDADAASDLPWPDHGAWAAALAASPAVADPDHAELEPLCPLVWDGRRLYLQRYFRYEVSTAQDLLERAVGSSVAPTGFTAALDELFGPDGSDGSDGSDGPDLQRRAAEVALTHGLSVVAGGPGTGKTRTIARLLAVAQRLAAEEGRRLEVALVAPTGKAAARMTEAVRSEVDQAEADGSVSTEVAELIRMSEATTIHSLLGWAPGTQFRHDRRNPLPHDLVVVDETSMVSLPLMARLLAAIRPDSSLVLVGDPFQLASVEAGTVMADLVGPGTPASPELLGSGGAPLAGRLTVLRRVRRFADDSAIAALAEAVRAGDADRALEILGGSDPDAVWVRDTDQVARGALERVVSDAAVDVVDAALAGDIGEALLAATRIKVLAATRHHPLGLYDWSDRIEDAVRTRVPELPWSRRWYVGRPIIVTANDRITKVSNGDVGLVVRRPDGFAVAMAAGDGVRLVPTSRLDQVETWWAMTIHKSQGSEFPHAVVSLPAHGSPILSRELLYTGITRARERVTIVAGEAALRTAIASPISRASGLGDRLWSTRVG